MHEAWIRFAMTGDPNIGASPAWPRYDDTRRVMEFGTVSAVRADPGAGERELWDGIW